MEDENLAEAVNGVPIEEEGVSVELYAEVAVEAAVESSSGKSAPSVHPVANTEEQHLAEAAAEPASLASANGAAEEMDAEEQAVPDSRAAATGEKPLPGIAVPSAKPASQLVSAAQARDSNNANADQGASGDKHAEAYGQSSAIKPAHLAPAPVPEQGTDTSTEQPDLLRRAPAIAKAAVKAASAPVTPATAAAEQSLEAPAVNAAAFAAIGSTSAMHRASSAPTRRLARKSSPVSRPSEQLDPVGSPSLTKQASPEGSCAPAPAKEASPKGSPASTPKRRLSPESTVYIPLGKAAEVKGEISPAKRARLSPVDSAARATAAPALAAAGPGAAARTPAAQARAAKLTKRTKAPSKLQLDGVRQRRLTRSAAPAGAKQLSMSPPQHPDLAHAPGQLADPSTQPHALNGLTEKLSQADKQTLGTDAAQVEQHAAAAGTNAERPVQKRTEVEQAAHETPRSSAPPTTTTAVVGERQLPAAAAKAVPATSSAEERGGRPMAYLMDRPKAPSPKVTAIAAPRPVAATDHRLSRLTDSSQESALTDVTPKVEESPEAVEERRQVQKQQEQAKRAREHQRVFKQVISLSFLCLGQKHCFEIH